MKKILSCSTLSLKKSVSFSVDDSTPDQTPSSLRVTPYGGSSRTPIKGLFAAYYCSKCVGSGLFWFTAHEVLTKKYFLSWSRPLIDFLQSLQLDRQFYDQKLNFSSDYSDTSFPKYDKTIQATFLGEDPSLVTRSTGNYFLLYELDTEGAHVVSIKTRRDVLSGFFSVYLNTDPFSFGKYEEFDSKPYSNMVLSVFKININ